jgi:hypothetical protein
MASKRLLAAITTSGAILSLSFSADADQGIRTLRTNANDTPPLSLRVEQLRARLLAASPSTQDGTSAGRIDHLVQFFNFFNCARSTWKNC